MFFRILICAVLAVLVYIRVEEALPLYFLWLAVAVLYVAYQGRFALMRPIDRPAKYETASLFLFLLDLAAHAAVAIFCRVGWVGIGLVILSYFCFGRLAAALATRRALEDIYGILARRDPEMAVEERRRMATVMLEMRRQRFFGRF